MTQITEAGTSEVMKQVASVRIFSEIMHFLKACNVSALARLKRPQQSFVLLLFFKDTLCNSNNPHVLNKLEFDLFIPLFLPHLMHIL